MSPREAFKSAFYQRCRQQGVSPQQALTYIKQASAELLHFRASLQKQANPALAAGASAAAGAAKAKAGGSLLQTAGSYLLGAGQPLLKYVIGGALVLPPAIGALVGGLGRRAIEVNDQTPEEIAADHLLEQYDLHTADMRRQRLINQGQGAYRYFNPQMR